MGIAMKKNDHLMTCKATFEAISNYLPKNKIIWMPFYGDGKCEEIMQELGFDKVIHEERDFFEYEPPEWDIIVDNPPYSIKKKVLERCASFKKPFVLLLPLRSVTAKYFRSEIFGDFQMLLLYSKYHHFRNIGEEEKDAIARFNLGGHRSNPIEPTWFVFNCNLLPKQLTIGD